MDPSEMQLKVFEAIVGHLVTIIRPTAAYPENIGAKMESLKEKKALMQPA